MPTMITEQETRETNLKIEEMKLEMEIGIQQHPSTKIPKMITEQETQETSLKIEEMKLEMEIIIQQHPSKKCNTKKINFIKSNNK